MLRKGLIFWNVQLKRVRVIYFFYISVTFDGTAAYCIHLEKKNPFFLSKSIFGLFFEVIISVFQSNFIFRGNYFHFDEYFIFMLGLLCIFSDFLFSFLD